MRYSIFPILERSRRSRTGSFAFLLAFLDLRNKESHDANGHAIRVEALVIGEQNYGQAGIEEMCVFDHAGADVKQREVEAMASHFNIPYF